MSDTPEPADPSAADLGVAGGALVLAGLLAYFAWLRETPLFWRNAGGYPVWLRDLVLDTFFPLLALEVMLLGRGVWHVVTHWPVPSRRWVVHVTLVVVAGGVMGVVLAVVAANNIVNLLEGRPLHAH